MQQHAGQVTHTELPRALPHQATVRFTSTFSWGGRTLNLAVYLQQGIASKSGAWHGAACGCCSVLLVKVAHGGHLRLAHFFHPLQLHMQLFRQAAAAHRRSQMQQLSTAHASQSRAVDACTLNARPACL